MKVTRKQYITPRSRPINFPKQKLGVLDLVILLLASVVGIQLSAGLIILLGRFVIFTVYGVL